LEHRRYVEEHGKIAMGTELVSTGLFPDSESYNIRRHAIDAIEVMFNRVVEDGAERPEPQDAKDQVKDNKLNPSGPLQNCEFGFALLVVREWLGDAFFTTVPRATYDTVVLSLTGNTVRRVLSRNRTDKGGAGEHSAFFTGEPYTEYQKQYFSANLDAAMITLAFLAPAVEQFNRELAGLDHQLGADVSALPPWVQNLRDAVLFVIQEGLEYAQQCRVLHNNNFLGFTSDPESNAAARDNGSIPEDDRLFFTWTACETIFDLVSWCDSFVNDKTEPALPKEAIDKLVQLTDDLEGTLKSSATWCAERFLQKFETFEPPENKKLVADIGSAGTEKALTSGQERDVQEMAKKVQNVYLMSQYAAIRSLVPESITPKEVSTIIDKLDLLVQKSIVESRLDDAQHVDLYRSLTRSYSLGKSNPESYKDDAWYPLVVRSLSGLLSRTLREIGTRFSRPEVLALTLTFKKSLQTHVRKMLERRPSGGESGPDGKLWSFAFDQPYVLYATQRTIFALIKYEEFLLAVDQFEKEVPDVRSREEEFSMIFAKQFMEFFRPAIKQLLMQVPSAASSDGTSSVALVTTDGELPSQPWAAMTIREWLQLLTKDFVKSQVSNNIGQQVEALKQIKKHADSYTPPSGTLRRDQRLGKDLMGELKDAFNDILNFKEVGPQLAQSNWQDDELRKILFDYLFQTYLQRPARSFAPLLKPETSAELWKLIDQARNKLNSVRNLNDN
jgi:hypothetical protein